MTDIDVGHEAEMKPRTERGVPPAEPQTDGGGGKQTEEERAEWEENAGMRTRPSPAPFSRYQTSVGQENHEGRSRLPAGLTTVDSKPDALSGQGRTVHGGGEEQDGAGCCKCVIM